MNDTSASTSAPGWTLLPDGTGVITTIHLVLIVVIALAAIAVIVVGARRKRLRRQAEQQVERNAAEAGVEPAPDPQDTVPAATTTPAPAPTTAPARLQSQTQTQPYRDPVARPVSTHAPPVPQAPPQPPQPPASVAAELPGPDLVKRETPVDSLDETTLIAPAGFTAPASPDALATPDAPLTTLKGLGPKVATRLQELGIDTVGQLAALSVDQADALDAQLGTFRGRMMRDRWIEQARFLAARDRAGFEAAFGRL